MSWIQACIAFFSPQTITPNVTVKPMPTHTELLYEEAKRVRGTRVFLDPSVDPRLGCATAVSAVIKAVKFTAIPKGGISGTASLLEWFLDHPDLYEEVLYYQHGCIVMSATGTGNGRVRGHVGIAGKNCIMSNNSQDGLWSEHWDKDSWLEYFTGYGAIPTRYFILK